MPLEIWKQKKSFFREALRFSAPPTCYNVNGRTATVFYKNVNINLNLWKQFILQARTDIELQVALRRNFDS